jgi:hypothetical protein
MLLLKRHLVLLVRQGLKRQTIRFWTRPAVRAGQVSYTPGLGRMKILAVDVVPSLDALTEEDAVADGFASLKELRAELRNIYGPLAKPAGRTLFRIKFEWPIDPAGEQLVLPAPQARPAAEPPPRSPRPPLPPASPKPPAPLSANPNPPMRPPPKTAPAAPPP